MPASVSKDHLQVRAERTAADSVLSQIIQLVEVAQSSKAPIQRLADAVSGITLRFSVSLPLPLSLASSFRVRCAGCSGSRCRYLLVLEDTHGETATCAARLSVCAHHRVSVLAWTGHSHRHVLFSTDRAYVCTHRESVFVF